MLDRHTEEFLKAVLEMCRDAQFRKTYGDVCMAARIAVLNVKGTAVKLRPSLLKLEELSEIKTAANVLKRLREVVGPMANAEILKWAAVDYVYKRILKAV